MAGNDWLNGYLEAIIDTGEKVDCSRSAVDRDYKEVLTATKYFVNEVTGYDDAALYRTWIKASAAKYPQEKGSRMEYLCWRIWHLARQKKKLAWEDAQQMARLHIRKDGLVEQFNDSEDFSEGEKLESSSSADTLPQPEAVAMSPLQPYSNGDEEAAHHIEKRLYIVLISVHGLVRGEHMELGRDSDTGGQVKYVVELAKGLAMMPEVYRVDLLTRQICGQPEVDWSYGEPTEMLAPAGAYDENGQIDYESIVGESGGAYIVRIPCGPRDQYVRKELLWPHIQEFVDGALAHILNMSKVLGEQLAGGESVWPHVIHGHYADAGDIAALLSGALNVPMVLTGHSLGRNKLEQLLKQGRQSAEDINATYKIMRRLEAEELSLDAAELVITSTKQEIDEQWGLYDGFDSKMERILRARALRGVSCHGRFMPRMSVIAPGMDFNNVVVQDVGDPLDGDIQSMESVASNGHGASEVSVPASPRAAADPVIWSEIMRFFSNPHKPMILALARPDPKKNMTTLLRAFGETRALRELANLTLVMGNREDIDSMAGGSASVLTTALKLIDKYDLYGQVAYPKHHTQTDVPEIYRLAAKTKGVFINPALVEPFGLTLIEAAAHGLPMVATKNGGPVDIHRTLKNGLLVDPHDQKGIADALLQLLADRKFWMECRQNGLKNIHLFSWPEHCRTYLSRVALCRMRHPQWQNDNSLGGELQEESQEDSLRDVHDFLLRLSIDGDKLPQAVSDNSIKGGDSNGRKLTGNVKNLLGLENGNPYTPISQTAATKKRIGTTDNGAAAAGIGGGLPNKVTMLRRRKRLVIIAVDSFDSSTGEPTEKLVQVTKDIFKAFQRELSTYGLSTYGRSTGFILSTSLTGPETLAFLSSGGISVSEFDALICSSGSELFYPAARLSINDIDNDSILCPDPDYKVHIDYRWGGEGLRKTMPHVTAANTSGEYSIWESKSESALIEDSQSGNSHCFVYEVVNSSHAPSVDQIRQRLRRKGLRCHVMYCQRESKLHVIPLLASRSQALRYLFVRWGFDVSNMFVFVGETGNTDYEELLAGTHKTIVLKGVVEGGSERLLRGAGGYTREDIAPSGSPNIAVTENDSMESILLALKTLGFQFVNYQ